MGEYLGGQNTGRHCSEMSIFSGVQEGPPIEVLHMKARHDADPSPVKINLTVGGYKDEQGKPWVLPVVRETEVALTSNPATTHEYLPALGSPEANRAAVELLLGPKNPLVAQGRAFAIQSLGGTGPLREGAEFLQQQLGCRAARYSDPTWINHRDIFIKSGFTDVCPYPYWNTTMKSLDFDGILASMEKAPPLTVYILHPMAHNPTGIDPTMEDDLQLDEDTKAGSFLRLRVPRVGKRGYGRGCLGCSTLCLGGT